MQSERKENLTVAMVQQDIVWESKEENYRRVEDLLERGITKPVDVIVLPETFNTAFSDRIASFAEPECGTTYDFALRMAQRYDALLVGTWATVDVSGDASPRNRMHLVAPDGLLGIYDKRHLFRLSKEGQQMTCGEGKTIAEWRGWRMRPAVCYDLRFPLWLRNGYDAGSDSLDYDLLLFSANWPKARIGAWDTLLKARAIENLCYVVGVNRTGIDANDVVYNGHSVAIDYAGRPISVADSEQEGVVIVELSQTKLADFRKRNPFYLDFD